VPQKNERAGMMRACMGCASLARGAPHATGTQEEVPRGLDGRWRGNDELLSRE